MSDIQHGNSHGRETRSPPSKSDRKSPVRVKSESKSGSPSRTYKRSESRSRSRSKARSHSQRRSSRRYSRSRSRSHQKKSRSRSCSPEYRRRRSQSKSPMSNRHRHTSSKSHDFTKATNSHGGDADTRANPDPSTCLGVFGLSMYTTERDLRDVFSRHGPLAGITVVHDQRTGRSRGFAFIYFERIADAKEAMEGANGMELDGKRIRVDFSITKRAHTPTPGIYMGRPTQNGSRRRSDSHYDRGNDRGYDRGNDRGYDRGNDRGYDRGNDRGYDRGSDRGYDRGNDRGYDRGSGRGNDRYDDYDYSCRRSPSPYYSRYKSRSRSRSYSPRRY